MKSLNSFLKEDKADINPDLECLIDNHFSYNGMTILVNFSQKKKKKLTTLWLSSLICEMSEFV